MAIDDVSFYTVTGEEISRGYLVEQMINYYSMKLDVGETKITDFNEGSEIRNLLEAIAVDMYILMEEQNQLTSMGFVETAEGEFLDKHGANPFIKLPRDTGMEANGFVTFKVDEAVTSETVIPEGTIVINSETGIEYSTLNDAIFDVGDNEVTVNIECLTAGEDGNCKTGEIDTIEELLADIPTITVINEDDITGGSDYEEDDEYRARLLNYVRQDDFGSMPYYIKLGSAVEGVHDIFLKDEIVNDNETPEFTKIVIVNGDTKPTSNEVLTNVLAVYSDINNIIIGHTFSVDVPNYISINLTVDLKVNEILDEEIINTLLYEIFDGGSSIDAGLEFEGLYMGENLTGEMLNSNLILLDGVIESHVYITGESSELDIINVDEDEVCKLDSVIINQTIVE